MPKSLPPNIRVKFHWSKEGCIARAYNAGDDSPVMKRDGYHLTSGIYARTESEANDLLWDIWEPLARADGIVG